jgi:ribonucleoside-diphosphate reductase beta chain
MPSTERFATARRRLGAIASARGADLLTVDRDASPGELEEKFHVEDELELTG